MLTVVVVASELAITPTATAPSSTVRRWWRRMASMATPTVTTRVVSASTRCGRRRSPSASPYVPLILVRVGATAPMTSVASVLVVFTAAVISAAPSTPPSPVPARLAAVAAVVRAVRRASPAMAAAVGVATASAASITGCPCCRCSRGFPTRGSGGATARAQAAHKRIAAVDEGDEDGKQAQHWVQHCGHGTPVE